MSIRILPPAVVSMIAAGEVVERPASAIKELVENAINAGARNIEVRVPRSDGSSFSVTDDGSGMEPSDLALAIQRHATSKLPDGRLTAVSTLGFRGEALPSIAFCASVTIRSRPAGQDVAFSVSARNGQPPSAARPSAGGFGTAVTVEGLFDEMPARKKFLKSDRTERAWIRHVFDRAAIVNPEVGMTLQMGGLGVVRYRPATLAARIRDVLGEPLASGGVELVHEAGRISVGGLVCMPSLLGASPSAAVEIFVNGRNVSSDDRRRPLGRYVGQANGSWLVAETMSGLVIVDQQAAHERVILERLKRSSPDLPETVVTLPVAVGIGVDEFEAAAVDDHAETFSTMGFSIRTRGREAVMLGYPSALSMCDPRDLLRMAVDSAVRGAAAGLVREAVWETLATSACRAAIKAGDVLDPERGAMLLREIEETPAASVCNHGRPGQFRDMQAGCEGVPPMSLNEGYDIPENLRSLDDDGLLGGSMISPVFAFDGGEEEYEHIFE